MVSGLGAAATGLGATATGLGGTGAGLGAAAAGGGGGASGFRPAAWSTSFYTPSQGVYLSPQQAKALLTLLQQNVQNYENTFGEIKLDPRMVGPVH